MYWKYKTDDIITVKNFDTGRNHYNAIVRDVNEKRGTVTVQLVHMYCTKNTPEKTRNAPRGTTYFEKKEVNEFMRVAPEGPEHKFKWDRVQGFFLNKEFNEQLYHLCNF